MENPFFLAIALLESREIATSLFRRALDHKADSPMTVKGPNWQLLVDDTEESEVRQDRLSPKTVERTPAPALEHVTGDSCM
jgi:hypothetical protein